jgi:mannose-6-phosphate isomerase-like protein (cupin superfamily)
MNVVLIILCILVVFVFGLVAGAKLYKHNRVKEQFLEKFIKKPWGGYAVLSEGKIYKVKILVVNKGHRLSLQYHHQREEYWVVLEGTATIRLGEKMYTLQSTEAFYVAKRALHRIENRHDEPLVILETQIGNYLEEDDIIRVQDDYERNSKTDESISPADGKTKKQVQLV